MAVMEGGEITYAAVFGSAHPDEDQALSQGKLEIELTPGKLEIELSPGGPIGSKPAVDAA